MGYCTTSRKVAGLKPAGCMDVCVVCFKERQKDKMQDNQDKEPNTDEVQTRVQESKKIFDGAVGIFRERNPSGRTIALGSTQPLTEMSTRDMFWR